MTDLKAQKEGSSLLGESTDSKFKAGIDEESADKLQVDVDDLDNLRSESGIIRHFEKLTGYSADKVCEATTQNLDYYLFRFTPSAE